MKIERNEENGLATITAIILMALIGLSLLVSCKTSKTTEVYVRDTLYLSKSDTVRVTSVVHHTDTLRDKEITRIILKESGDTIKVFNDHYIYRYIEKNDSTAIYKSRIDSLLKVLDQRKNEKQVKTKIPLWQYGLFVAVLLVICIWILHSKTFFKD